MGGEIKAWGDHRLSNTSTDFVRAGEQADFGFALLSSAASNK